MGYVLVAQSVASLHIFPVLMKRFVLTLTFASVLGFLVVALSLTFQIWHGQAAVEKAFAIPNGTRILCLGSSHTGCTWQEGDGVHSVWLNGSAFVLSLMRLKEMERLGQLKGVRCCLVDADYEGLCGRLKEKHIEETFLQSVYYAWRYLDFIPGETWKYIWSAVTWLGHRRDFKSSAPQGGNIYEGLAEEKKASLIKKAEEELKQTDATSLSITEANKSTLDEMKRLCDTHGIRLILFASPLVKDHPMRGVWRGLLDGWKSYCKKQNVEYWDLRDEMPDELFYDIDHLSDEGRRLISKKYLSCLCNGQ